MEHNAALTMAGSSGAADFHGVDPDDDRDSIDERLELALGRQRKLFEAGCVVSRGGSFGGYGSFLPVEVRQPSQVPPAGAPRTARPPMPHQNGNGSKHTKPQAPPHGIIELVPVPKFLAPEAPSAQEEEESIDELTRLLEGRSEKKEKKSGFVSEKAEPSSSVQKRALLPGAKTPVLPPTGKLSIKLKIPNSKSRDLESEHKAMENNLHSSPSTPDLSPTAMIKEMTTDVIAPEDVLSPLRVKKRGLGKGELETSAGLDVLDSRKVHGTLTDAVHPRPWRKDDRAGPHSEAMVGRDAHLRAGEHKLIASAKKEVLQVQNGGSRSSVSNVEVTGGGGIVNPLNPLPLDIEVPLLKKARPLPGALRVDERAPGVKACDVAAKGHEHAKKASHSKTVEKQQAGLVAGDTRPARIPSDTGNPERLAAGHGGATEGGKKSKEKAPLLRREEKTEMKREERSKKTEMDVSKKGPNVKALDEDRRTGFLNEKGAETTVVGTGQGEVKVKKSVTAAGGVTSAGNAQKMEGRARMSKDPRADAEFARGAHGQDEEQHEPDRNVAGKKRKKPSGMSAQGGTLGVETVRKKLELEQKYPDNVSRGGAAARGSSHGMARDIGGGGDRDRDGPGAGGKRAPVSPTTGGSASKAKGKLQAQGINAGSKAPAKPRKSFLASARFVSELEVAPTAPPSPPIAGPPVVTDGTVPQIDSAPPKMFIDNWVSCDTCHKWRLLPTGVTVDTAKWFCRMNTWSPHLANCKATDKETANAVFDMENTILEERSRILATLEPGYIPPPPIVADVLPAVAPAASAPPIPLPAATVPVAPAPDVNVGKQAVPSKLGPMGVLKKGFAKRVTGDATDVDGGAQRVKSLKHVSSASKKWPQPGVVNRDGSRIKSGSKGGNKAEPLEKRDSSKGGVAEKDGGLKKRGVILEERGKRMPSSAPGRSELPLDGLRAGNVAGATEKRKLKAVPGSNEGETFVAKATGVAKRVRMPEALTAVEEPPAAKKVKIGRPVVVETRKSDSDGEGDKAVLHGGAGGDGNGMEPLKRDFADGGNGYSKSSLMLASSDREYEGKREEASFEKQKGSTTGSKLDEEKRQDRHRDGLNRSVGKGGVSRGGGTDLDTPRDRSHMKHREEKSSGNRNGLAPPPVSPTAKLGKPHAGRSEVPVKDVVQREAGDKDTRDNLLRKDIHGMVEAGDGRKEGIIGTNACMNKGDGSALLASSDGRGKFECKPQEYRSGGQAQVKKVVGEHGIAAEAIEKRKSRADMGFYGAANPKGLGVDMNGVLARSERKAASLKGKACSPSASSEYTAPLDSESLDGRYDSAEEGGKEKDLASPMESTLSSPAHSRQDGDEKEEDKAVVAKFLSSSNAVVTMPQDIVLPTSVEARARISSPAVRGISPGRPVGGVGVDGFRRSQSRSEERVLRSYEHNEAARPDSLRPDERGYSPEASRERDRDRDHFSRSQSYRGYDAPWDDDYGRHPRFYARRYERSRSRERYRDHGERERMYRSRDRDRDGYPIGRERERERERDYDRERVREESGSSRPIWERERERERRERERGPERDRAREREPGWDRQAEWTRSSSREPRRERPLVCSGAPRVDVGSAAATGTIGDNQLLKVKSLHAQSLGLSPTELPGSGGGGGVGVGGRNRMGGDTVKDRAGVTTASQDARKSPAGEGCSLVSMSANVEGNHGRKWAGQDEGHNVDDDDAEKEEEERMTVRSVKEPWVGTLSAGTIPGVGGAGTGSGSMQGREASHEARAGAHVVPLLLAGTDVSAHATEEREEGADAVPPLPLSTGPTVAVAASTEVAKMLKEAKEMKRKADKLPPSKLRRQLYMESGFKFLQSAASHASEPEFFDKTASIFEFCAQHDHTRDALVSALALKCAAVARTLVLLALQKRMVEGGDLPGARAKHAANNSNIPVGACAPAAVKSGTGGSPSSSSASDVDNIITQAGLLGLDRVTLTPSGHKRTVSTDVHRNKAQAQTEAATTVTIPTANANLLDNVWQKSTCAHLEAWKKAIVATGVASDVVAKKKVDAASGHCSAADVAAAEKRMEALCRVGEDMGMVNIDASVKFARKAMDDLD